LNKTRPKFWPLELALGLLPFAIVAQIIVWIFYLPLGIHGFADFRQLYTGGYMIRTGNASLLYDFDSQQRFQQKLFPESAQMVLLITHPAFEELLFIPLSLLQYRAAYWVFFALNLLALFTSLGLLLPKISRIHERWRWAPILLVASFFPISRALLQGQDSILLLLLLCIALVMLDRGAPLSAGLVLGIGIFRFQIVLPIAILFLLWRQFRFVGGLLVSSGLAALTSLALVGAHGVVMFVKYMLSLSVFLGSESAMTMYRDTPLEMLNLRGLISAILWQRAPNTWIHLAIFIASMLVMLGAWRLRPSLRVAIVAASLVSYHFIAHDASIWLIPILFALASTSPVEGAMAVGMLLSPFIAAFLFEGIRSHAYLASLPLLGFFLVEIYREERTAG